MAATSFDVSYRPLFNLKKLLETPLGADWLRINKGVIERVLKAEAKNTLTAWQKAQHFFGYGTVGFHTLNHTIEKIAEQCIHDLVLPIQESFKKIQSGNLKKLSPAEQAQIRDTLTSIYKVQQEKRDLLDKVRVKFYREFDTTLSKCAFAMASILEMIRSIPHALWNRVALDPTEQALSAPNIYQKLLQPYCRSYLIWQANNSLQMYFIASTYCHRLEIHRDNKCIGDVTFHVKKEVEQERPTLYVTNYKVLDITGKALIARFFNRLKIQARLSDRPYLDNSLKGLKIFDETGYTSYPNTSYNQELRDELIFMQSILDYWPHQGSHHLIQTKDILITVQSLN